MITKPTPDTPAADRKPWCCELTCDADAEFDIYTTVDGQVAGPDPYSDDTQACANHVGALLGHQPDLHESLFPRLMWQVRPLGADPT